MADTPPLPRQDTPLYDAERALSAMLKQRNDLNKRILDTSTFINASRPINRLPVELLVTIFRHVHEGPSKHQYTTSYADHIERDPPWYPMIAVVPETKTDYLELVLSNSRELPINVDIYAPPKVAPLTKVLLRHRTRIASLHVQGVTRAQASHVGDLVDKSMPCLRALSMWFDPLLSDSIDDGSTLPIEEEEVFMFELALKNHPELQALSLRGVGLQGPLPRSSHNRPPNLTHLELRDSTAPDCNIVEFVSFLRDCHQLETITLVRFRPFDEDFDTFSSLDTLDPLPVVNLTPTLRHLVIEDIDMYIARLLSGLVVPASTDLTITKIISQRDRDELRLAWDLVEDGFLTVLPDDRSGLPIFNLVTGLHFCHSDRSACLVAQAGQHRMTITIKVAPDCPSRVFPDIQVDIEELAAANDCITELTVMNVGDLKIWGDVLSTMLCTLPRLKTLSAFSVGPSSGEAHHPSLEDELVETIGQPSVSDACTALEELNVNTLRTEDDISLVDNLELLLQRRDKQGMRLRRLRVELSGRGDRNNLSDEERVARESWYLDILRPLVDVVECAHRMLIECPFESPEVCCPPMRLVAIEDVSRLWKPEHISLVPVDFNRFDYATYLPLHMVYSNLYRPILA